MGYLEIKKSKKTNFKVEKSIDDLIKEYEFSPSLNIEDYLAFAFNNYKILIKDAIDYHQNEVIGKGIKISNSYILEKSNWIDEFAKTDKDEYYRRIFIFEYLEKFK